MISFWFSFSFSLSRLVADGSRKLIELAHPLKHFFEDPRTHKTVIEDSEEVVKEILAFLKRVLGEVHSRN
jgi:hypothetical protein